MTELDANVKVKMDSATVDELARIATAEDRTVSSVIRRAIRYYLQHRREGKV